MKKLIAVVLVIALLTSCLCACAPVGMTAGVLSLLLSQCSANTDTNTVFEQPALFDDFDVLDELEDAYEDIEDAVEDVAEEPAEAFDFFEF
jgi:hypothetical protein